MAKKKRACSSYDGARDVSSGTTFWTKDQEEVHDHVYKKRGVFSHKYVKWSDNTDLIKDVAAKYENLGVKNLITRNEETWAWDEDIVRKFYSTLTVTPDFKQISFMVGPTREVVTKEKFEETLGIKSMTDGINLHELTKQVSESVSCKKVINLEPEVDLIQKINRCTLLPRQGNRGECSELSIRLANAIWKGEHFDVTGLIFTEMSFVAKNKRELPYGPYICALLRGLECITDKSIGEMCFPMEFSSNLTKKLAKASNARLQKQVESLKATNIGLREQLESAKASNIRLVKQVESVEASKAVLVEHVKSLTATVDKLTKQMKGSGDNIEGLEIVGKASQNVVVQSEKLLENAKMQPEKPLENAEVLREKPLEKCYTRRGSSRALAAASKGRACSEDARV